MVHLKAESAAQVQNLQGKYYNISYLSTYLHIQLRVLQQQADSSLSRCHAPTTR